jgi:hypothetical protein
VAFRLWWGAERGILVGESLSGGLRLRAP